MALSQMCSRRRLRIEVLPTPNAPESASTGAFAIMILTERLSTNAARPSASCGQD